MSRNRLKSGEICRSAEMYFRGCKERNCAGCGAALNTSCSTIKFAKQRRKKRGSGAVFAAQWELLYAGGLARTATPFRGNSGSLVRWNGLRHGDLCSQDKS